MRVGFLALLVLSPFSASASELCLAYPTDVCCPPGFPPCDFPAPMRWTGFSTTFPPCEGEGYWESHGLSISASDTDPLMNVTSIPSDRLLYLWLLEPQPWVEDGYFDMTIIGDIPIAGFHPFVSGTGWNPVISHLWFYGCGQSAPFVIGAFEVDVTVGVTGRSWGRTKVGYR
jgi:hypothetical protein